MMAFLIVLANGAVLGLSWDGLPSLAPAVVLKSWSLVFFLFAYFVGTFTMMGFATALVGEATCWINTYTKVNIAERLAAMSSVAAVLIGCVWITSAALKYSHSHSQQHFAQLDELDKSGSLYGNDGTHSNLHSRNDNNNDNNNDIDAAYSSLGILNYLSSIVFSGSDGGSGGGDVDYNGNNNDDGHLAHGKIGSENIGLLHGFISSGNSGSSGEADHSTVTAAGWRYVESILSASSILAVVLVIWAATYYEFTPSYNRSSSRESSRSRNRFRFHHIRHAHQV